MGSKLSVQIQAELQKIHYGVHLSHGRVNPPKEHVSTKYRQTEFLSRKNSKISIPHVHTILALIR
jgi:hypothetical protein